MANDDPKVKVLRRIVLSTAWIEKHEDLETVSNEYSEKRRDFAAALDAVKDASQALKNELRPLLASQGIDEETDWRVSEARDEEQSSNGLIVEIIQRKGRRRIETEEL